MLRLVTAPPPVTTTPAGPPPAFWALAAAANAEYTRRTRQATFVAVVAGLVAVFALGASLLPEDVTTDLLVGYVVFLLVYGVALALALLRVTAGPYGAAIAVGAIAHNGTLRARVEATGETNPPTTPIEAAAWLARHPEEEGIYPQRLSTQILAGDLAGARASLARYPRATAFERYWLAADAWFLDVLEGRPADLAAVEAEVEAVTEPALRAHAESGLALLRAHAAITAGRDWIAPMAAVYDRVAPFVDNTWRTPMVVRLWTWHMVIAAAIIGAALLVARLTGVWPGWA